MALDSVGAIEESGGESQSGSHGPAPRWLNDANLGNEPAGHLTNGRARTCVGGLKRRQGVERALGVQRAGQAGSILAGPAHIAMSEENRRFLWISPVNQD
jgi:hypothetical protein